MSIPKTIVWSLVAFLPAVIGMIGVALVGFFDNQGSEVLFEIWGCFNVLCSVVASLWIVLPHFRTRGMGVFVGLVTGLALAVLNGLITMFAGCVLV